MAGNANSGRRPRADELARVGMGPAPVPDICVENELACYRAEDYRGLPEAAKPTYRHVVKYLMKLRLLTPLDFSLIAKFAFWEYLAQEYRARLVEDPFDKDMMEMARTADRMVIDVGGRFGLSVYDRQKLRIGAQPPKQTINNKGTINMLSLDRPNPKADEQ